MTRLHRDFLRLKRALDRLRKARSASGIVFSVIHEFETLRLEAYDDGFGNWTIGWGHTGSDVYRGQTISLEQASRLLVRDVSSAAACVARSVKREPTQGQFDAMTLLTFNIGCTGFRTSDVVQFFNKGEYARAADAFLNWIGAGGRAAGGLSRRRATERAIFLS